MRGKQIAVALALALAVLPVSMPASATDGFALFERFRADERAVRIRFTQNNYDKNKVVLESSTGTLWYQVPNRFRMEYDAADKPLVVSDGSSLWVYEDDLKQATVRPLTSIRENSLLSVLSVDGLDSLKDRYVFSSSIAGDLVWLVGSTLWQDDQITRVQFGFSPVSGDLRQLEMVDSFGGGIALKVLKLTRDTDASSQFLFTPPVGADVIHIGE